MTPEQFHKLKKEGVKNPEEHEKVVEDAVSMVAKDVHPLTKSVESLDIEKLEKFCVAATENVVKKILPDFISGGLIQDRRRFTQRITLLYLEEFHTLPHDELLFIACQLSSQVAIQKAQEVMVNQ